MASLYNINNKKVLFIHIPKTGGSSIGTKLLPYEIKELRIVGHQDIKQCLKIVRPDEIFTVVRNPWDWRSSWFNYLKDNPSSKTGIPFENKLANKHNNINEHLKWLSGIDVKQLTTVEYNGTSSELYIKSQSDYIQDNTNIHIIRFENIEEGFKEYMSKMGLNINLDVKVNSSSNNNYKSDYNKTGVEIVKKLWNKDIVKFKYEF